MERNIIMSKNKLIARSDDNLLDEILNASESLDTAIRSLRTSLNYLDYRMQFMRRSHADHNTERMLKRNLEQLTRDLSKLSNKLAAAGVDIAMMQEDN